MLKLLRTIKNTYFCFFTNPFGFSILSNCVLLLPNFYPSRGCQFYSCVIFMHHAWVSRTTNFLTLPCTFQFVRTSRAHYLRACIIPDITCHQYCTEMHFVSILHRNLINLLMHFDILFAFVQKYKIQIYFWSKVKLKYTWHCCCVYFNLKVVDLQTIK